MHARDIHIRVTPKDGSPSHVQQRRVWDADRFMASVQAQYNKEGKETVTLATEAEYKAQQQKGKK